MTLDKAKTPIVDAIIALNGAAGDSPVCDPMAVLLHTSGLERLSEAELRNFADGLHLVRYSSGTILFETFEDGCNAPLRIIVQGKLVWTAISSAETAGAPTLGAGAIFGLASVNQWAGTHEPSKDRVVEDTPGFLAEAHDELWVIELDPSKYHHAFAAPECRRLLNRVLGLYGARPHAPQVIQALRRTPEFSRACPLHVSRLVQAGVLERWELGECIEVDGTPKTMALRYVVSGTIHITVADTGLSTVVAAGALISQEHIFASRSGARTLIAIGGPAEVIRIRRAAVDSTIRTTPGFARMLGPATLGSWMGELSPAHEPVEYAHPIIASGEMALVLPDPRVTYLPLRGLIELLAFSIREHLGDTVWIVRLVPARIAAEPEVSPFGVPRSIVVPDDVNLGDFAREALTELATLWGLLFDQILIDPSDLDLDDADRLALMRAMVGLPCPSQISYIVASPEDWAALPVRLGVVPGVHVLPTALLAPKPGRADLRRRFEQLLHPPNEGPAPASRRAPKASRGSRPKVRGKGWLGQRVRALGQMMGVPRAFPMPWPLDAVRLRLSDAFLAAIDSCASPAHFDRLQLDSAIAAQSRENCYRWARAITWRRVGIGIGGAGAQSYASIPLIRKLVAAGVPIDVLAGSSTGAFISAFYSVFGDWGLDEIVAKRHHFGFGVAIAWFNNIPFELLLTSEFEAMDLNDLEIPVIAVASRAADGATVYLSSSLAGQACMASGSLPPMTPTYVRNQRLLDGGLTQDVPTAILASAGAELIVGVQPVPRVNPTRQLSPGVFVPPQLRALVTANPLLRTLDYYRSYLMLFRQAARSEDDNADVVYEATTKSSNAGFFFQGARIAREAATTPALDKAVRAAVAEWEWMLMRPPGRVALDPETGKFVLGNASAVALVEPRFARRKTDRGALPRHALNILNSVAHFVSRHPEFDLSVVLCVPQDTAQDMVDQWMWAVDAAFAKEEELRYASSVARGSEYEHPQLELGVIPPSV